jgi:hypothetical protein
MALDQDFAELSIRVLSTPRALGPPNRWRLLGPIYCWSARHWARIRARTEHRRASRNLSSTKSRLRRLLEYRGEQRPISAAPVRAGWTKTKRSVMSLGGAGGPERCTCHGPPITSENGAILGYSPQACRGRVEGFHMDLVKTPLIESVFAGGGMRALDWSATVLDPLLSVSLAAHRRKADASLIRIEPENEAER